MKERKDAVTMKGNPLTLLGDLPKVGDHAADAVVVDNSLQEVKLSDWLGRSPLVISAVPSLDTSVCDRQTRRFNKEATSLGEGVKVLTISMDLPFAQKRWCGAAGVENVQTLSDYRYASFGQAYGVLIKSLHLLARSVFVIDASGIIQYVELVRELTNEPQYDPLLQVLKQITC